MTTSRYTITIECSGDEGDSVAVKFISEVHDEQDVLNNTKDILPHLASDLARAISSVEAIGRAIPAHGEQVLSAFSEALQNQWDYWKSDDDPVTEDFSDDVSD